MSSTQKKQAIILADSIKEQIGKIVENRQNHPLIEVDILKENLRKLYEIVEQLTSSANKIYTNEAKVEAIDTEIENLLDEASKQFNAEAETKAQIIEQESVLDEQIIDDDLPPEILDENTTADNNSSKQEIIEETTPNKKIISDKKLSEKEESKKKNTKKIVHVLDIETEDEEQEEIDDEIALMGEKLKKKAIKSLKQGIGINDKFMIINDLFEGRTKEFNAAIKELDNQENQQAAIYLLEDMKDENLWESKDNAYIQLKSYVIRRYL